ncbi:hypothetical protein ABS755_08025 [Castellaniella sp. FW104-16D08]|uniref:hypothetical protein n=1 Tax=unclassified Castellaniella TaxID=2617606 RepID=UPI0033154B77
MSGAVSIGTAVAVGAAAAGAVAVGSGMFNSKPSAPKMPALPAAPTAPPTAPPTAQQTQAPDEQARRNQQGGATAGGPMGAGNAATLLTGAGGVQQGDTSLGKNTLLGG